MALLAVLCRAMWWWWPNYSPILRRPPSSAHHYQGEIDCFGLDTLHLAACAPHTGQWSTLLNTGNISHGHPTDYSAISYLNICAKKYQNIVWSDVFLNKSIIMINYGFAWRPCLHKAKSSVSKDVINIVGDWRNEGLPKNAKYLTKFISNAGIQTTQ